MVPAIMTIIRNCRIVVLCSGKFKAVVVNGRLYLGV